LFPKPPPDFFSPALLSRWHPSLHFFVHNALLHAPPYSQLWSLASFDVSRVSHVSWNEVLSPCKTLLSYSILSPNWRSFLPPQETILRAPLVCSCSTVLSPQCRPPPPPPVCSGGPFLSQVFCAPPPERLSLISTSMFLLFSP